MIAVPDPSTFQVIPWTTEDPVARMFCDIYEPDGTPFDGDPRGVLKRQLRAPPTSASRSTSAPSSSSSTAGRPRTRAPRPRRLLRRDAPGRGDRLSHAHGALPRVDGHPRGVHPPRGAPSQHEIDLRYTDALTMADNVMTYRLTVKEVATASGIHATFMPKPIAGVNGNGMHTHQSLFDGDRNAFFDAGDPFHLSATARSYIAGHAPPRTRDHARHEPVGQLATSGWSPGSRRRSTCAGRAATAAPWSASPVQAGQGGGDADRVPLARPGLQPLPRVLRDARGRPRGDRGRLRTAARGLEQHLRDDARSNARRPASPPSHRTCTTPSAWPSDRSCCGPRWATTSTSS